LILDWKKNKKRIIGRYKRGKTLREIAEVFNTTHVTINKRLSLWGIQRRGTPHGGKKRVDHTRTLITPGYVSGVVTVLRKEPIIYPTRYHCVCVCGKHLLLSEWQLQKERTCKHLRRRKKR